MQPRSWNYLIRVLWFYVQWAKPLLPFRSSVVRAHAQ